MTTGTRPAAAVNTRARNWIARDGFFLPFFSLQYQLIAFCASSSTNVLRSCSDFTGSALFQLMHSGPAVWISFLPSAMLVELYIRFLYFRHGHSILSP